MTLDIILIFDMLRNISEHIRQLTWPCVGLLDPGPTNGTLKTFVCKELPHCSWPWSLWSEAKSSHDDHDEPCDTTMTASELCKAEVPCILCDEIIYNIKINYFFGSESDRKCTSWKKHTLPVSWLLTLPLGHFAGHKGMIPPLIPRIIDDTDRTTNRSNSDVDNHLIHILSKL